jgi:hypothetical protein
LSLLSSENLKLDARDLFADAADADSDDDAIGTGVIRDEARITAAVTSRLFPALMRREVQEAHQRVWLFESTCVDKLKAAADQKVLFCC